MTITPAVRRYELLRQGFIAAIPQPGKLSRKRRREISWAATLSLAIEEISAEVTRGIRTERPPELELFRELVNGHLAAAHSNATFETRAPR